MTVRSAQRLGLLQTQGTWGPVESVSASLPGGSHQGTSWDLSSFHLDLPPHGQVSAGYGDWGRPRGQASRPHDRVLSA